MPSSSLIGLLLDDKYQIEESLGEGGMGSVYRATHLGTKRTVALKVIRPQFSSDEEFILRFRREAEAAGRLRHPNVVDVTDFGFAGTDAGRVAYLVMEYLDGCTLAEILAEEPRLPLDWVLDILDQTCSAVDQAHRLGIIHRDLKPENIWLEPNRRGGYTVKVLDFGLAKLAHSDSSAASPRPSASPALNRSTAPESLRASADRVPSGPRLTNADDDASESQTLLETIGEGERATQIYTDKVSDPDGVSDTDRVGGAAAAFATATAPDLTRLGSVMGTPLYMSPEQSRGEPLDARSDIYSLGVVAYRMLAGEPPFVGDTESLIRLHREAEPVSIGKKNRKISKRAGQLIMSALAKDPAFRPQSAAAFATALRARAERTGTVFRQAFALYSERFPAFFKLSLLAYIPLALLLAIQLILEKTNPGKPPFAEVAVIGLGFMAAHLFAYAVISAVTVLIVLQLAVTPLRPVSLRPAFASLKKCWLQLATTLLASGALRFIAVAVPVVGSISLAVNFAAYTSGVPHSLYLPVGLVLLVPGLAVAAIFSLCGPVVAIERPGVIQALKRAAILMKRSKTTVIIIALLQLAVPVLLYALFNRATIDLDIQPHQSHFGFDCALDNHFTQLFNILTTPLLAIMAALVYLKTRRSGGETLDAAAEQIAIEPTPQTRLSTRTHSRRARLDSPRRSGSE